MEYLPTIRQLQYLLAIAEHGSFSKAAENCSVTQSTLSAGIKELEISFGAQVRGSKAGEGQTDLLPSVKNVVLVAAGKGGVGKSSITCNLAAISASRGLRTLVVDLDVQGNSSYYLGVAKQNPSASQKDFAAARDASS